MAERVTRPDDVAPGTTPPDGSMQAALNRVGRKLTVADVTALGELDEAFRAWVEERRGTIHWDYETRLLHAIAAVIHVEIVEDDDDE